MAKPTAISDYELLSSFEAVRSTLLGKQYRDYLPKPLAFWALPNDRRLPLAFMTRSLGDLLDTSFEDLYATPGVGRKKIRALINLLLRAATDEPPPASDALALAASCRGAIGRAASADGADTNISESEWVQWRTVVRHSGLAQEALGRYAASLQKLPRVIWSTPLAAYIEVSLSEMRALKTYGEKRVNAILEVFAGLQSVLTCVERHPHLHARLGCRFAHQIEDWIARVTDGQEGVSYDRLRENFIDPLVAQLRVDAGEQVAQLAESRLSLTESETSVRQMARKMALTRARIYQLMDGVQTIVQVRWPAGSAQVRRLASKLSTMRLDSRTRRLFETAVALFFSRDDLAPPVAVRRELRSRPAAAMVKADRRRNNGY